MSINDLLASAVSGGASVEALSQLMDLHERHQRNVAEQQFNEAVTLFQSLCPVIDHDKEADTGKYKYTYTSLAHIADVIRQPLSQCGLTYSFDSKTSDGQMEVTCTIHHSAGHKRSSVFACPIDKGARMNVMQQGASALSYARRYALLLALGISTADTDDDAQAAQPRRDATPARVTQDDVDRLRSALKDKGFESDAIDNWIGDVLRMNPALHAKAENWQLSDLEACRAKYKRDFSSKEAN